MQHNLSVKRLSQINRNLISIFCCFLIIAVAWLGVCLDNSSLVLAEPISILDGAIGTQPVAMDEMKGEVKNDLKRAESGLPNQNYNNVAKQSESAGAEVDGRSGDNVAKIQGKGNPSGDKVENAIEDAMDRIRERVK
jgi:hypothetical protein